VSEAGGWDCHVHVFDGTAAAQAGHYRPVERPLAQIEAVARTHGVEHLVLVQPSVYGVDNTLLLRALAVQPGRHRGVVVVADDIGDAELETLQAAGVRGVRFNCVSPVGERGTPRRRFAALAPRLRRLGWHVQWYAHAAQLTEIAEMHAGSGVVCVLDHLAGFDTTIAADDAAWQAAAALAAQGAWLKLSGWYRLGAPPPYDALVPSLRRLGAVFGDRLVWGSDWPHTLFAPETMPDYATTWQPVVAAFGPTAAGALKRRRPPIYD
jgi:predicted TIM-barrel fold metal-dependent hydrolase